LIDTPTNKTIGISLREHALFGGEVNLRGGKGNFVIGIIGIGCRH